MRCILLVAILFAVEAVGVADPAFSIIMNVTGWSPMFAYLEGWDLNFEDGSVTSLPPTGLDARAWLHFIGTSAVPYGSANRRTRTTDTVFGNFTLKERTSLTANFGPTDPGEVLADLGTFRLGSYTIRIVPSGSGLINFQYVLFELPIVTEAPSEEALRSTAITTPTTDGDRVNSAFSIRRFESDDYILDGGEQSPAELSPTPPSQHEIVNGSVLLGGLTEMTFSVPPNTSLVNVTGPVYGDNSPSRSYCYAILNPEPWWWNPRALPKADAQKQGYRPDQTLLMLPLDPTVEYRLVIGALGRTRTCSISGITTYSYVKSGPSGPSAAVTKGGSIRTTKIGGPTTTVSGKPSESADVVQSNSRKVDAGVIAGPVVGVIVGLVLVGLLAALVLRRRRQRSQSTAIQPVDNEEDSDRFELTEDVQVVVPFIAPSRSSASNDKNATEERHKGEGSESQTAYSSKLEKHQESSIQGVAPSSAATAAVMVSHPPHHAEDMEDAGQDALLPPVYKAAWGQRYVSGAVGGEGAVAAPREHEGDAAAVGTDPSNFASNTKGEACGRLGNF